LRDHARRVLQSQNEGWPEANRQDARRELNWAYDRFVSIYGPINKTTFGETSDGTTIRRMPNLVKFREDPDAMLVMALEEYDEATGEAAKEFTLVIRKRHVPPDSLDGRPGLRTTGHGPSPAQPLTLGSDVLHPCVRLVMGGQHQASCG
jgi:N12 class adenine-specific DNA methylase